MSENTANNENVRDDEIDLLDLFNRMGRAINRGINALIRAFLVSLVFVLRRWLPLCISVIIGLAVSYTLMKTRPSQYISDMVLRNNSIPSTQMISYINRLQMFDKQALSKTLGIPLETTLNIGTIGAFWIIDRNKDMIPDEVDYENVHDVYDTTNIRMPDRLDVRISVSTQQNLDFIREGIIRYIKSDSTFGRINMLRNIHNTENA